MEQAQRALTDAIALVERVMNTLPLPDQRRAFLQQYTELYALTAITQVRRDQDAPAKQTLAVYARIAGSGAVIDYIQAYENQIPVAGEDVSDTEAQTNKNLVKRLKRLRNRL